MSRILVSIPRHVLISAGVILFTLILFGILMPVLGGARDDAFSQNGKLKTDIEHVNQSIAKSQADIKYVTDSKDNFESLLQSDRLIPHTRRAATVELENAARANRLTSLSYSITAVSADSAKAVSNQPISDAYHVSVENIELKTGAFLDGSIYQFVQDISDSFPGSAVVQSMTLSRVQTVDTGTLAAVSSGTGELVHGEIGVAWRTAQAQEKDDAGKNGK